MEVPALDGIYTGLRLLHESRSGYCQIWLAGKFRQLVILKCLSPAWRDDPVYEELLRKEFDLGYGLNHPAICRTFNFFRHQQLGNCIEMEYVDGETLAERFADARPDAALFRKIAGELCDAVQYLHSRQIIHRDIKPSNILITHHGDNVKLIDFGLADSDTSALFKMPAGTRAFIAPEVLAGQEADVRSDIYSVGKVLSSLTDRHSRILRKCCAPMPDKRFQHIHEVKEALQACQTRKVALMILTGVCAILLAALLIPRMIPSVPGEGTSLSSTTDTVLIQRKDTVFIQQSPARPAASSAHPASGPAATTPPDVTSEDIDQLFQEATGLFE